jgi:hypothetical protein
MIEFLEEFMQESAYTQNFSQESQKKVEFALRDLREL